MALSFDTTQYATNGRLRLTWTDVESGSIVYWRIYSRENGSTNWEIVAELAPGTTMYDDYLAESSIDLEYGLTQYLSNDTETTYTTNTVVTGDFDRYVLICPGNPSLTATLFHVNADNFSDEKEMAVLNIIGRGRQVQYGTSFGVIGTLTMTFYDNSSFTARQQRKQIEALRDAGLAYYLRTPFGDVWSVASESMSVTRRSGMGLHEAATATFAYTEVSA